MSFFHSLSLTIRISFYSYDTIIQYPHYLYSAGWNGLKWIITKRNIGMRLAQIYPPYFMLIRIYVECWMEKWKNRYGVHYIQCIHNAHIYVYFFFIHWMEFLIGYASCQFSQKPFSISTSFILILILILIYLLNINIHSLYHNGLCFLTISNYQSHVK